MSCTWNARWVSGPEREEKDEDIFVCRCHVGLYFGYIDYINIYSFLDLLITFIMIVCYNIFWIYGVNISIVKITFASCLRFFGVATGSIYVVPVIFLLGSAERKLQI